MSCLHTSTALKPLPGGKVGLVCQACGRQLPGTPEGGVYPRPLDRELADALEQRDELLKLAAVSYELASYANESKLTNQPEFLEGLFERIAAFEHAHTVATTTGKEGA